jgi:acyl-CoA thioester hydrolase
MTQDPSPNLVKEPESTCFIHFQDCDALQHLNNARYFDYFLNAREEHTHRYYNVNLMELARRLQANWVVTNHQIAYLKPADHGQIVVIQTRLIHFDNGSLVIEGVMLNEEKDHLKALLWTTMRFVSLQTGKPADHPDELMDMLEQLDVEEVDYEPDGFQHRVKQVNRQARGQA